MGFAVSYAFTMGATSSSASVNLQAAYERIYMVIPSMPSSSALDLYASQDGTTYYQMRHDTNPNTATVLAASFIVAATAGANGGIVPLPGGFQYYKIIATDSAPTSSLGFKLVCGTE